jgi:hypothetical protein
LVFKGFCKSYFDFFLNIQILKLLLNASFNFWARLPALRPSYGIFIEIPAFAEEMVTTA